MTDAVIPETEVKKKPARKRRPRFGVMKGMRVRIYPTPEQETLLFQWIGARRWTWNWALAQQNAHYEATGKHLSTTLISKNLTRMLADGIEPLSGREIPWLREVPRTSLTCTLNALKESWSSFFDGVSGKRPDKPGRPRFHSYHEKRKTIGFQVDHRHGSRVDTVASTLNIPILGKVSAVFTEAVPGELVQLTIARQGGIWHAALALVNVPEEAAKRLQNWNTVAGDGESGILVDDRFRQFDDPLDPSGFVAFDASVVHGAVATSDGKHTYSLATEADRKRLNEKIARRKSYQRRFSRKHRHRQGEYNAKRGQPKKEPLPKGTKLVQSKRQRRLADKIAKIDLHLKNARDDRQHKFTTGMVRDHHTIIGETLLVKAMAKSLNSGFRRRLHEAAMGEIFRQLKYKCEWYGRTFIQVDRWFPSSKRCSNPECHEKNTTLKLSDSAWTCPHCQSSWDRDDNAAFNLWQEGQRLAHLQHAQEQFNLYAHATNDCVGSAVGSTVVARQGGDILGDLDRTPSRSLEAMDKGATEHRCPRSRSSVNREAFLTLPASGRQTPERDFGMDPNARTAE